MSGLIIANKLEKALVLAGETNFALPSLTTFGDKFAEAYHGMFKRLYDYFSQSQSLENNLGCVREMNLNSHTGFNTYGEEGSSVYQVVCTKNKSEGHLYLDLVANSNWEENVSTGMFDFSQNLEDTTTILRNKIMPNETNIILPKIREDKGYSKVKTALDKHHTELRQNFFGQKHKSRYSLNGLGEQLAANAHKKTLIAQFYEALPRIINEYGKTILENQEKLLNPKLDN